MEYMMVYDANPFNFETKMNRYGEIGYQVCQIQPTITTSSYPYNILMERKIKQDGI